LRGPFFLFWSRYTTRLVELPFRALVEATSVSIRRLLKGIYFCLNRVQGSERKRTTHTTQTGCCPRWTHPDARRGPLEPVNLRIILPPLRIPLAAQIGLLGLTRRQNRPENQHLLARCPPNLLTIQPRPFPKTPSRHVENAVEATNETKYRSRKRSKSKCRTLQRG
jgi:hypothetical protein